VDQRISGNTGRGTEKTICVSFVLGRVETSLGVGDWLIRRESVAAGRHLRLHVSAAAQWQLKMNRSTFAGEAENEPVHICLVKDD
jgi:hypothetical protein